MYIISYILLYLYITRSIKLKKKKDLLYIYWICVNIFEVGYCSKITHVWIVWLGLEVTGLEEEEEEEETEVEVGAEAAGEEEAEGDAATKHKWQQRS